LAGEDPEGEASAEAGSADQGGDGVTPIPSAVSIPGYHEGGGPMVRAFIR